MKTNITILLLLIINFINGQTKESDFYTFYKGGEKYLKPLKYVLFDSKENNVKRQNDGKIYFQIKSERFVFDESRHKIDTFSINLLNKIKLENCAKLRENEVLFYKKEVKKTEIYKKTGFIYPFPISNLHPYFKVIILEKRDDKVIKYEVDWEYSDL